MWASFYVSYFTDEGTESRWGSSTICVKKKGEEICNPQGLLNQANKRINFYTRTDWCVHTFQPRKRTCSRILTWNKNCVWPWTGSYNPRSPQQKEETPCALDGQGGAMVRPSASRVQVLKFKSSSLNSVSFTESSDLRLSFLICLGKDGNDSSRIIVQGLKEITHIKHLAECLVP